MLMSLLLKSRKGQGYEQRRFSQQSGRRRQCSLRQAVMDAAITKAAKKKKKPPALKSQKQVRYGVKINSSLLQL